MLLFWGVIIESPSCFLRSSFFSTILFCRFKMRSSFTGLSPEWGFLFSSSFLQKQKEAVRGKSSIKLQNKIIWAYTLIIIYLLLLLGLKTGLNHVTWMWYSQLASCLQNSITKQYRVISSHGMPWWQYLKYFKPDMTFFTKNMCKTCDNTSAFCLWELRSFPYMIININLKYYITWQMKDILSCVIWMPRFRINGIVMYSFRLVGLGHHKLIAPCAA